MLRVLDLFSGIGGFSLGLERTGGFQTVAFCEIEPFPRRVLARRWPNARMYRDVEALTGDRIRADGLRVDCICGGFPCQDISLAGRGAGLAGERSGLWWHYARIIDEVRPGWVIIENVAALRSRGLDVVLGTLAAVGYDAEWHCIPASAVGAPHRRDRVWIIAHTACGGSRRDGRGPDEITFGGATVLADPTWDGDGRARFGIVASGASGGGLVGQRAECEAGAIAAYADSAEGRRIITQRCQDGRDADFAGHGSQGAVVADATRTPGWPGLCAVGAEQYRPLIGDGGQSVGRFDWWSTEPDVGRVADGVPARVDRLTALGNAVVPQIPELIGRAILAAHAMKESA